MAIIKTEPRRVGRPQATKGTVRVLPAGLLRLSPDLCIAKTFQVTVDIGKKQLIIKPDGPHKLRRHGQSGMLTTSFALQLGGIDAKSAAGEYVVRRLKDKGFIVDLQER
jgi:hypothetical protein